VWRGREKKNEIAVGGGKKGRQGRKALRSGGTRNNKGKWESDAALISKRPEKRKKSFAVEKRKKKLLEEKGANVPGKNKKRGGHPTTREKKEKREVITGDEGGSA